MTNWPPELLTPEELEAVAGCKQIPKIVEWLEHARVPHIRNREGQPLVYRHRLFPELGAAQNTATPNFGAIHGTRRKAT